MNRPIAFFAVCCVALSIGAATIASDNRTSSAVGPDGGLVKIPCNSGVCHHLYKGMAQRPHLSVSSLHTGTTACSAKFVSLSSRTLHMFWDDGKGGVAQGPLRPGAITTTNTYETHEFYFKFGAVEVARAIMQRGKTVYPILDESHPGDPSAVALFKAERRFSEEYEQRTGIGWRHYFGPEGPRPPPILPFWPAPQVGTVHGIYSPHGFWSCQGPAEACQSPHSVNLDLECISISPRAFIVENFLSDFEADAIIAFARGRVRRSGVGDAATGRESDTRTSFNAWLQWDFNEITATVSHRVMDLLRLDYRLMVNAEQMQVVHYDVGQRYEPHHDWGVGGNPASRFITVLMYLTDQERADAGGETSFPKSENGLGFKVKPVKGTAVVFYNLLEDGNGDDNALHAALPVSRGEKWLANYWIWDPVRS